MTRADDPVTTIMTTLPLFVDEDARLQDVASLLAGTGTSAVVVLTWTRARGVLRQQDIARAVAERSDLGSLRAKDIMATQPTPCLPATSSVGDAAGLMARQGIHDVLVVDGGEIIGMVSIRDTLRALLESTLASTSA